MKDFKREDFKSEWEYLRAVAEYSKEREAERKRKARVVDINENKPHEVSEVICVKCYKRWLAVRPEGVRLKDLECPNCGKGYVIETGEKIVT